ncbi:MAG TPA: CPBP family intramembrane glutamic endopeptidase [Vicinamibacterales bacterium]|nr:CPBP family intramembrane glutamic endopeptidase [Vicinamibacterales bacterium]
MTDPGVSGWIHLVLFGAVVPYAALRSKRVLDANEPLPRLTAHLWFTMVNLTLFGVLSIAVARAEGIPLSSSRMPPPVAWLAGAALLVVVVPLMSRVWRRAVEQRRRVVALFAPRGARERALWVATSAVAGASEEITWRGVQFALLGTLLGAPVAAAIIAAVMFGAAHVVQGVRAAGVAVVYALVAQVLVWLAGSLYVAIAVHATYDILAGLAYGRLAEEAGYFKDAPASTADPENRS